MKAVILAGGYGSRLAEETRLRPKPMVEIGGRPILWHIMKTYAHHGVREFVICLGYRGDDIRDFFLRYRTSLADVTVETGSGAVTVHSAPSEDWRVHLVDTGRDAMTGGRLKAVAPYLQDGPFHMTYGDGVGDVDIAALEAFHRAHGKLATVTAVTPPGRFGILDIEGARVTGFREKAADDGYRVNAGFFVLDPACLDYVEGPSTVWEQDPMRALAADGQLMARHHPGFWQPMDTLRDKQRLEALLESGAAPWTVWERA